MKFNFDTPSGGAITIEAASRQEAQRTYRRYYGDSRASNPMRKLLGAFRTLEVAAPGEAPLADNRKSATEMNGHSLKADPIKRPFIDKIDELLGDDSLDADELKEKVLALVDAMRKAVAGASEAGVLTGESLARSIRGQQRPGQSSAPMDLNELAADIRGHKRF